MRRLLTLLALFAPLAAEAKPLVLYLDDEVARARYVLEGRILSHDPERATSRVAITSDVRSIFRGFEVAGTEVDLGWPRAGHETFRHGAPTDRSLLFVVREDGSIAATGTGADGGWRIQGWYDFNAVLVRIDGRTEDFEEMQHPHVPRGWFWAKTGSDPRSLAVPVARCLLETIPDEEARGRFDAAIEDLDSDLWDVRERAEEILAGPLGIRFLPEIERLAADSPSPDVRHRLGRVAAALATWRTARRIADGLAAPGPDRWRVLAACLGGEDEALASRALETLRKETGHDLPGDPAAWFEAIDGDPLGG